MCGIAGFISRTDRRVEPTTLAKMVDAVAHRGPDGEGSLIDGRVGLGHRRLAIIDLSEAGNQPMRCGVSGRYIIYNGEIYNYVELRRELEAGGYPFRSQSDTEVILAAYDRWGATCVTRFNGMWAFAIHDPAAGKVFCSRDRFGVKPFYYLDDPGFFAFGSEIRQLLLLQDCVRADRDSLLDYLGYALDERGEQTFFNGIRRLLAGHNLTFDVRSGGYSMTQHYRLPRQPVSRDGAAESLREILTDSVRLRLRSDVPVGTCLSGGLDSSSIAAIAAPLARESSPRKFAAITAASESAHNDESAYAGAVVERADLDWHCVRPDYDTFVATLPEVVRAQEEPFTSASICMQYFVMQEAKRQRIPVLLDGQGADEALLGYERYTVQAVRDIYSAEGLTPAVRFMLDVARNNERLPLSRQLALLGYFSSPRLRWLTIRRRQRGAGALSFRQFRDRQGPADRSMLDVQRREIEIESIPHLLRYEDKNSMWHSIETRLPFMDYRLVEFAINLPSDAKLHDGWSKHVLREAMTGVLPDDIIWRKNKLGFEAPENLWLPRLRQTMIDTILRSELLQNLSGAEPKRRRLARMPQSVLWRLYIASLWGKEFGVTEFAHARQESRAVALSVDQSRRVCTRCVMDGTDPDIWFDGDGVCNHCRDFDANVRVLGWAPGKERLDRLQPILERVKDAGRGKPYDSILGLSGGVDSSYLALKLREWGLRPLVMHVDGGWNSELAVANIERIVNHCGYDLHTHVVDWEEMRDLQLAYLRAGVANQDVPQDHAFFASLYHYAVSSGIKTVFSGGNLATEGIFPNSWEGSAMDARNLRAIHAQFGEAPLRTYRTINFTNYYLQYPFVRGMRTVRPLNYLVYDKQTAIRELEQTVGWRAYDRKHGESLFTKWFQNHYMPQRFNFDKRRPHYASLIVSGQMSRGEALRKLEEPLYAPDELDIDITFLIKKLRITRAEYEELMRAPLRHHSEFSNQERLLRLVQSSKGFIERITGRPVRVYS